MLKSVANKAKAQRYGQMYFNCTRMMSTRAKYLIETNDLAKMIDGGDSNLKIVNASWYLPAQGIIAR
jgi:hypothetical protein